MRHYLKVGTLKALAAHVILLRVRAGLLHIRNAREYRREIVRVVHSAFANSD